MGIESPKFETQPSQSEPEKESRVEKIERKEKIENYLKENLPESEERIKEPMNPNCEVSVVIPAYGERDYIFRPLESLAKQEGVESDQYETIVVVNNLENEPERNAYKSEKQYKRDLEQYHKSIPENQEILKLIRFINGEDVEVELNDYEKETVKDIKESGMKIFSIDKASPDKGLIAPKPNVGMARDRGVAEAVERFYKQLDRNGIIAQTDADTRVGENYIQNLIKVFKERPKLIGLAGELSFEKTEPEDEFFKAAATYSEMEYRYRGLLDFFEDTQKKDTQKKEGQLFTKRIDFSGANMASRAFEAAIVGGVPKEEGGEDPDFAKRLSAIGEIDQVPEVKVITADRPSARAADWASHGQKKIKHAEAIKEKGTILVGPPEREIFMKQIRGKVEELIKNQNTAPEDLKQIFRIDKEVLFDDDDLKVLSQKFEGATDLEPLETDPDIKALGAKLDSKIEELMPEKSIEEASSELIDRLCADERLKDKYEIIKKQIIETENKWVEKRKKTADGLLGAVFKEKPEKLNTQTFIDILKRNKETIGLDDEAINGLEGDRATLNQLTELIAGSKDEKEAMSKLEDNFKDSLTPVEENPLFQKTLNLRAMHQATREFGETEKKE